MDICVFLLKQLLYLQGLMIIQFIRRYFNSRINDYRLFHILVNPYMTDYKLTLIFSNIFLHDNIKVRFVFKSLMNVS